jgi:hypothetical protein
VAKANKENVVEVQIEQEWLLKLSEALCQIRLTDFLGGD